ncbi:MAG: dihydropteroate synthase [Cellvibrionaceae bacterium]|jgi:dihydropteroate synthase
MIQLTPQLKRPPHPIVWGDRTYIMGILNATPDSFSGDGISSDLTQTQLIDRAIAQAVNFVDAGADVLDIGGESTRPNSETIDGQIERSRILDVIREVRKALPQTVISVDTYRAKTAEVALAAGADWINDIWGFKHDSDIAGVAAVADCPVVLMHNGRNRRRLQQDDGAGGYYGYFEYESLIEDVLIECQESIDIALDAGVQEGNIMIDPGIGFGKTAPQNIELMSSLARFKTLGYPILLGTSRKGFIGQYLGGLPVDERVEGTIATCVLGIAAGVDILRVHDVQAVARATRMADVIVRSEVK